MGTIIVLKVNKSEKLKAKLWSCRGFASVATTGIYCVIYLHGNAIKNKQRKLLYKVDSVSFTTLSAALLLIIHYLRYMYINKTVLSWAVMQLARNKSCQIVCV